MSLAHPSIKILFPPLNALYSIINMHFGVMIHPDIGQKILRTIVKEFAISRFIVWFIRKKNL